MSKISSNLYNKKSPKLVPLVLKCLPNLHKFIVRSWCIKIEVCTQQYLPHLHILELDYGREKAKGCSIGPGNSQEHFKKLHVFGCSSTLKYGRFLKKSLLYHKYQASNKFCTGIIVTKFVKGVLINYQWIKKHV
jgi:hypothetical protein